VAVGLALGVLAGCSDAVSRRKAPSTGDAVATKDSRDPKPTEQATEPQRPLEKRYYDGYLAEAIRGDVERAREAYQDIVSSSGNVETAAALAALRLADLDARSGRRREGLEMAARRVLGDDDIVRRASRLQLRLGSVRTQSIEVRGPAAGTPLSSVSAEAAARFSRAETLLTLYHRRRLPRIEDLGATIRQKQNAMDLAVRAYRSVIELGEPAATVASEYRIGSLYNDLSVSLLFDLPAELERDAATLLRRSLSSRALADLREARDAYRRCLEAAELVEDSGSVVNWRAAAELGLRTVEDLLRGRE
jgi:hypothetical protein